MRLNIVPIITPGNDGTLSGTIAGQGQTSELQNIKLENGVVTFAKPRRQRANILHNYRGLLEEDGIKDEMIVNGMPSGQTEEFSWTAKKVEWRKKLGQGQKIDEKH